MATGTQILNLATAMGEWSIPMRKPGSAGNNDTATRRSLVERLANPGDDESWETFYKLYGQMIHRFAIKRGLSATEADDVVQETVLCVNRKMPTFQYDPERGSFRSWLLHTAQWRISDQIKKRGKEVVSVPPTEDGSARTAVIDRMADRTFSPEELDWDGDWRTTLVELALDRLKGTLPAKQFQVFELYVLMDWPVQKVARTLGVNSGFVYLTKHRVWRMLKREVETLKSKLI